MSARTTLDCGGLADRTGRARMHFYPEHPHLTGNAAHHAYPSTAFDAVRGDDYVARRNIESIDFVKIDVEGAESLVLEGFQDSIDRQRIACIQFEYGAFSLQTRVLLADYYKLLAARYWIGKIFPTHVEFNDYHWTLETFRFANFLCVSRVRPDIRALAAVPRRLSGSAAWRSETPEVALGS